MLEPVMLFDEEKKKPEERETGITTDSNKTVVLLVGRSRSQALTKRVTPTTTTTTTTARSATAEKLLPNGDLYVGSFSGTVPNGSGKYLWSDGCMYVGDWKRGKAHGKGKFSWPSGATFEGDFKSGRMDGSGTFTGPDGDTYSGSWSSDRKHGQGKKRYANGDSYDGSWRRNAQDGRGRYVWRNGNEYVGEWRNGVIHGRGILIWANGNEYHGNWDNGVPRGQGVFNGNSNNLTGNTKKRSSVDGGSKGSLLVRPRICIWDSDGEAGDITCEIVDNVKAASVFYNKMFDFDGTRQFRRSSCCFINGGEMKRPGQTISKGHKNYDLMLNLQLGIRYSVGKYASIVREIKPGDFDPKEKFWTRFPTEGSKTTPPHQSGDFKWKDYCPMVFRHLRELFQVDPADYMLAICGNAALRELSSPGKSGSFFYLTQDDRFMIKTVKKSEVKVLIKMLPSYHQHVCQYKNSLVTKFFGVHCVKPIGGLKTRFIVMGNLFCSDYRIHRRFDLKGSSHGRTTDKLKREIDETTTLKDLDLDFVFRLQTNWFQELIKQIDRDCQFLEGERIMDYSLLVGIHFREDNAGDKMGLSPFLLRTGKKGSFQNEKFMRGCHFLEAELQDIDRVLTGRKTLIRLGANMPARAERMVRKSDFDQYTAGGFTHSALSRGCETYDVVLYFGIIDILQDYDISKKLEHAYKSLQADPISISAVDPNLYSRRFRDFIGRIFVEER
ncbi:hypothetical protein RHSIM_Rhsim06G0108400 [Rhododendron simsii]|uniref:Phosphatidylinositol 4-phosphate 5-kinase n=1 Tax=Rhododendron simsii TaxID=118357 RepID=A0A834LKQ4_RHOSS|nr:hypothetical protein RHSIM_Rhsim06G0108400 [Rhododendron simsii]